MSALTITPGASFSAQMAFKDAAGAPINLTGYTVTASFLYPGGSVPFTVAIADAASGLCALTMSPTDTAGLSTAVGCRLVIKAVAGDGFTSLYSAPASVIPL